MCKGTDELETERRQPSQGQLPHDDAPKAQGRSPVVDGAAPLCDGLVKLERLVAGRLREAISARGRTELASPEWHEISAKIRVELNAQESLGTLIQYLKSEAERSPAQSELSGASGGSTD